MQRENTITNAHEITITSDGLVPQCGRPVKAVYTILLAALAALVLTAISICL